MKQAVAHKLPLWPWGGRSMTVANSNTMALNSTQMIKVHQKSNEFTSTEKNPPAQASLHPIKDDWVALKKATYDCG